MIIEISIAVIALAFVALVIFLILFFNSLRRTLSQVDRTLVEARNQFGEMGDQAKKIIEQTNELSCDLKNKMESLNSIFNSLANMGDIIEHKTYILKKEAFASSHKEGNRYSDLENDDFDNERRNFGRKALRERAFTDILDLAGIGVRLWQNFKKRR